MSELQAAPAMTDGACKETSDVVVEPGDIVYVGQFYEWSQVRRLACNVRRAFNELPATATANYRTTNRSRFAISENNPTRIVLDAQDEGLLAQGQAAVRHGLVRPTFSNEWVKATQPVIMISTLLVMGPGYYLRPHIDPNKDVRVMTNLGEQPATVCIANEWDTNEIDFDGIFYPESAVEWATECVIPPGHSYLVNNLVYPPNKKPHKVHADAQRFMLMQSISGMPNGQGVKIAQQPVGP